MTAGRTALIIPALDEAEVIGHLVQRVPADWVSEVIVVDNGSTDGTALVAARAGARVIHEPRRGYGSACWAGVAALADDVEIAAFLDGDGSQHPEELPRVLAPLLAGQADFVMGVRQFGRHHPLHASLGTRAVAAFVRWRYAVSVTDIAPCRAIRLELLRRLRMRDRGSGWPVEMVVKAAAAGARMQEVSVSQSPRLGGRSKVSGSFVGSVRAGSAFVATALRAGREMSRAS